HAREPAMKLWSDGLKVEQHQINRREVGISEAVAQITVGVEGGMHAHLFGRGEHLEDKLMLHQRLAAAYGQAAAHGVEAVAIFPDLLDCPRERHRDSISHFPGVRIVAVRTLKLTAAQ